MPYSDSSTEIIGELDRRWRPVLDVELIVLGVSRRVRCTVDTGCDDPLVFRSFDEGIALGLQFATSPRAPRRFRFLADGTERRFVEARATIRWFAQDRSVTVLAPDPEEDTAPEAAVSSNVPGVLIGIPLLIGCQVHIDLLGNPGRVIIHPPPPGFVAPVGFG